MAGGGKGISVRQLGQQPDGRYLRKLCAQARGRRNAGAAAQDRTLTDVRKLIAKAGGWAEAGGWAGYYGKPAPAVMLQRGNAGFLGR
jgi:hypothetical protein